MSTRTRIEKLEQSAEFASEPRDFAELVAWTEAGRAFEIEPGSRWWPLAVAAEEGEMTNDD